MMDNSVLKSIDENIDYEAVKRLMIDLVESPSPQTERLEEEPQVREFICKTIEPMLREMGLTDLDYDSMGNLVGRFGENTSGKRLMLVTHAMNHPPATMPDPYKAKVIDGEEHGLPGEAILGRGLCEQKAGMAAMLAATRAVLQAGVKLPGELLFLTCTSGETGKHDALRNLIEDKSLQADLGLIDGSSLKIRLGNRGRLDIFVTVEGKVSHSGSPHAGANAITGARLVLDAVEEHVRLPPAHPDVGECTLTCTHLRSFPDATHTLQGSCELTFDRRLLPGEDPDEIFEEFARIVKTVEETTDPVSGLPFKVNVQKGPFMYPSLVAEDSQIVGLIKACASDVLGREPETHYGKSAFDQGYLNHIGIETANFGPGEDEFAHTDLDMASVQRTYDAARIMARMLVRYLGD